MKLSFSILSIALLAAHVAGQCSICPGGSSSITDIRAVLVKGEVPEVTCGDIDDKVRTMGTTDATCTAAKEDVNSEFDYSKFCCDDVRITNIQCTMCSGRSFDVNRILPSDTNPQGLTCGEAKAIADVTIGQDSVTCTNLLAASSGCCDQSCSVCPIGSTLNGGNRVLPGNETLTCEQFNLELEASATTRECNSKKAAYSDFDLESYCDCSGSRAPALCSYTEKCALGIANRSDTVSGTSFECSNFERVADYIKTSRTCNDWSGCCRSPPVEPASGAASLDSRTTKLAAMFTLGVLSLLSL